MPHWARRVLLPAAAPGSALQEMDFCFSIIRAVVEHQHHRSTRAQLSSATWWYWRHRVDASNGNGESGGRAARCDEDEHARRPAAPSRLQSSFSHTSLPVRSVSGPIGVMLRIRYKDIEKSWRWAVPIYRQPFCNKIQARRIWNGWQPPSSNPLSLYFIAKGLARYFTFTLISQLDKCCTLFGA